MATRTDCNLDESLGAQVGEKSWREVPCDLDRVAEDRRSPAPEILSMRPAFARANAGGLREVPGK
jgi:hypothetical protein